MDAGLASLYRFDFDWMLDQLRGRITAVASLKAHFDGRAIVLDEPATLAVGQAVRVIVENAPEGTAPPAPRESRFGFAKGMFEKSFTSHADATAALMHGEAFDERDALHIDPLDAVPGDFVRLPGSGAGEIKIADDFDETPDEFEEYP
jgi:hypothetical protein